MSQLILFGILFILLLLLAATYKKFFHIYLLLFLLLGDSYLGKNEMLFGIINIGKHEFKLMGGLTLFSKDIIVVGGIFSLFLSKIIHNRKKIHYRNTYFGNVIILFIVFIILNLFFKLIIFQDILEPRSFRVLIRNLGPLMMYFVIVQYLDFKNFKKFIILASLSLIITSIAFIFALDKITYQVDEYMLSMGSLVIWRLEIPHGFALWVPYFIALSLIFSKRNLISNVFVNKKEDLLFLLFAGLSIVLLLTSAVISTYRTYTLVLIFGILIAILNRFSKIDSVSLFFTSFIIGLILITANLLSELFKFDVLSIGFERVASSYYDIKYGQGTALARFNIIQGMLEKYLSNINYLLFGTQFTKHFLDYFSTNNDIGILSTLTQSGIFVLVPIIYLYIKVFRLFNFNSENKIINLLKLVIIFYFLSILPAFLFNYNIINEIFHSQVVFVLLGIFDAHYKRSLENFQSEKIA